MTNNFTGALEKFIFSDGKDKEAEKVIRQSLEDENPRHKLVAFLALAGDKNTEPETIESLEEFKKNPDNLRIIKEFLQEMDRVLKR